MSILGLALLGYVAGLAGSILGGVFNVVRVRNDQKERQSNDSRGLIIVSIVLWMIFTSKALQISKVLVAVVVAFLCQGGEHSALCSLCICGAFGFAFMVMLPVVAAFRNEQRKDGK